jgi:hypothetical protein
MRKSRDVLDAINEALSAPEPYKDLERSRKKSVDQMIKLWARGATKNLQHISSKASEWKGSHVSPTLVADEISTDTTCPVKDKKVLADISKIKECFLKEQAEYEQRAEEECISQADALSACTGKQFYVVETHDSYRTYDVIDERGLKKRGMASSDDEVIYVSE